MLKNPWVVIGLIAVVLIGSSVWYSGYAAERNNEGVVVGTVQVKGNPDAAVVLVEYSDFQCPACAAFQPVVADVLSQYGDVLRFEYKHFPLPIHPLAEPAARAAEAAGQQGKFFEFHDKLFLEQASWSNSPNASVFFMRYADELGLDTDTFSRHMKSTLLRDEVRKDAAEARERSLTGTPTFFLNGERMQIETYQDFFDQIARAVDPSYGLESATTTDATGAATGTAPVATPEVRFGI